MKRQPLSLKLHGYWVRHKEQGVVGRVAYYAPRQKLIAVVWEPESRSHNKYARNTAAAGLYPPSALSKLNPRLYPPQPWYDDETRLRLTSAKSVHIEPRRGE